MTLVNSYSTKNEKETSIEENIENLQKEEDEPEIVTRDIKRRNYTLEIAAGAILGALSVLIGIIWDLTFDLKTLFISSL